VNSSLLRDAEYWRRRAQELAALASSVADPNVRQAMSEIAQGYERLAELAHAANGRTAISHAPSMRRP
jgi:hypothetical protein